MTKTIPLIAAGLIVAFAWLWDHDRGVRHRALLENRLQARGDSLDSLRRSVRRIDTVFRQDTSRLRAAVRRRDTVRVEIDRFLHDTVPVPVEVVRRIVVADSVALNACMMSLRTCEQRVSVRDSLIGSLNRQLKDAMHIRSSRWSQIKRGVTWLGIGFGAGYIVAGRR